MAMGVYKTRGAYIPREVRYGQDRTERMLINPDCVVQDADGMRAFLIEVLLVQGGEHDKMKDHPKYWDAVRAGLIRITLDGKKVVLTSRGEALLQTATGDGNGNGQAGA